MLELCQTVLHSKLNRNSFLMGYTRLVMGFFQKYDTAVKLILFVLVVGNTIIVVDSWLNGKKKTATQLTQEVLSNNCGASCQAYIDKKIDEEIAALPTPEAKETIVEKITTVEKSSKTQQTTFIPISGGETTTRNVDWVSLDNTQFTFDQSDYGASPTITWDANIKVDGDSKAYVRLYDGTHGIGVQGSEQTTTSGSYINLSAGPLAIWQGRNTYKVQIKSLNGAQVYYSSGRLKVVYVK